MIHYIFVDAQECRCTKKCGHLKHKLPMESMKISLLSSTWIVLPQGSSLHNIAEFRVNQRRDSWVFFHGRLVFVSAVWDKTNIFYRILIGDQEKLTFARLYKLFPPRVACAHASILCVFCMENVDCISAAYCALCTSTYEAHNSNMYMITECRMKIP